jgi:hypothetical protein
MKMKKAKILLLPLILIVFSFLYMATSVPDRCLEDCQKVNEFSVALQQNRNYIYGVYRCSRSANGDTLCIYAYDSVLVNWNLLADTACAIATQKGLVRQTLFILDNRFFPVDTLAVKQCP